MMNAKKLCDRSFLGTNGQVQSKVLSPVRFAGRRSLGRGISVFALTLLSFFMSGAGEGAEPSHVRVQLLAEPSAVSAGVPFFVALKISHDPEWHTYYKEPGDSGLPTKIRWNLPEGFIAGEIQWPVPQRIEMPPLVNFGYEGEATLLVMITPPDKLPQKEVTLAGRVTWLECKEECVPGATEVSVVVPVADQPGPPSDEMRLFFEAARARLETGEQRAVAPAVKGLAGGTLLAILFACVGGLLLNFMPCVLPVLSIKFIGFVETPRETLRRHGLLYGAGVVLSFLALAGLLIFLRAGGERLGWGFQLQSPIFVGFMAGLFFLLGLNLWGFFEIGTSLIGLGGLLGGKTAANAFLSGALAVLVATPCTAPFMGPALGFALTQPAGTSLAIFASMGIGMAFPYVLLSFFPAGLRWIPKPGAWMVQLKKGLSILFFGTCLWLLWVLTLQLKPAGVTSYSQEKVEALLAEGRPVFVDFTAAWCITCQVNERTTLSTDKVKQAFKDNDVTVLIADWTNRDPAISMALEQFGRSGVPLYVLYYPGRDPVVLPTVLTPGIVIDAIGRDSPVETGQQETSPGKESSRPSGRKSMVN
jgi:thiol:disulfide interchange protein